jgi:hypothetical protein
MKLSEIALCADAINPGGRALASNCRGTTDTRDLWPRIVPRSRPYRADVSGFLIRRMHAADIASTFSFEHTG